MPAGDITLFVAAHWQQHVRYVTRHIGQAITRQVSYGFNNMFQIIIYDVNTHKFKMCLIVH